MSPRPIQIEVSVTFDDGLPLKMVWRDPQGLKNLTYAIDHNTPKMAVTEAHGTGKSEIVNDPSKMRTTYITIHEKP